MNSVRFEARNSAIHTLTRTHAHTVSNSAACNPYTRTRTRTLTRMHQTSLELTARQKNARALAPLEAGEGENYSTFTSKTIQNKIEKYTNE